MRVPVIKPFNITNGCPMALRTARTMTLIAQMAKNTSNTATSSAGSTHFSLARMARGNPCTSAAGAATTSRYSTR